jgi:hypothetical protein
MAKSPLDQVESHWHKLVDGLEASSVDLYNRTEMALKDRGIPGLKTSRVIWNEGGMLSPRREYLRVEGEHHAFDLCAAPFGRGFFFSSWMTRRPPKWVTLFGAVFLFMSVNLYAVLGALLQGFGASGSFWIAGTTGFLRLPFVLGPLAVFATMLVVALGSRAGFGAPERALMAIPIIGWAYGALFAPSTYYRLDTMLMFQSAVHGAWLQVIDEQLQLKGLRSLAAEERKPIFREPVFGEGTGAAPPGGSGAEPEPSLAGATV